MNSKPELILGLMSGTSLDGLDLALCEFDMKQDKAVFKLVASETIPYNSEWKEKLQRAHELNAETYFKLHHSYGVYIGEAINDFLLKEKKKPDYIASHGHTVFHKPEIGFTTQIGCGATIAGQTGIATVCDFRSSDVAVGGQGAPLVPIGDRDLFHQYESCLNIGGIANISYTKNATTKAFDICFANMAFNYLTETIHKPYDDGGKLASQGSVNSELLNQLLAVNSKNLSLGREFFETNLKSLLDNSSGSLEDKLATCVEYCAMMISKALNELDLKSVLITGGGAYNSFLMSRLKQMCHGEIQVPNDDIIQFKEAVIFAYLGYLRVKEKTNTLSSVTGARKDSIGGCMYLA